MSGIISNLFESTTSLVIVVRSLNDLRFLLNILRDEMRVTFESIGGNEQNVIVVKLNKSQLNQLTTKLRAAGRQLKQWNKIVGLTYDLIAYEK